MSETNPTPTELRERRQAQVADSRRPQPQDHLPKKSEQSAPTRRAPLDMTKPFEMEYLGKTFYVYPKAYDDFSQIERIAGIELDPREVDHPSPGYADLASKDEALAELWDTVWRYLGWGSIPDEDVKTEYSALRSAIYDAYGYCSAQLVVKFGQDANEHVQGIMDPEGNSGASRTS